MPKEDTQFRPGPDPRREATKFTAGTSGNPAGTSKLRRQFQEALFAALVGEGSAEEVAQILWKAARKGEAWGVQTLLQYLAPQKLQVELRTTMTQSTIPNFPSNSSNRSSNSWNSPRAELGRLKAALCQKSLSEFVRAAWPGAVGSAGLGAVTW